MEDDNEQYVNWFRHSSPYINAYRGKVFVLMLPGEALAHSNFHNIAHDITLLNSLGVKLVLVHGARLQINEALKLADIEDHFHNQLRVTDQQTLDVVKDCIGKLRIEIEAVFSMGLINSPMHGADITIVGGNYVIAKPFGIYEGVDYSHTGEVRKVNHVAIHQQLANGNIVLISNLGYSPTGEVFNLTVEEVAASTAIALQADKLIVFTEQEGILNNDGKTINKLSIDDAELALKELINGAERSEEDLMRILGTSVKACRGAVKRTQIISYQEDGALLTELFTRDGSGTLITQENYEQIRPANIDDVGGILELIRPLEINGTLVHRSRELLENEIAQFTVIEREGMIIACAALYPLDEESAELACIVTHQEYRNGNRAHLLLEALEDDARKLNLSKLFVLTTKTPHWFVERGFKETKVKTLPEEKQNLYNYQRNSKVFEKEI